MAIRFELNNNTAHNSGFRNRRASMRQTEDMRNAIFAKYQALVGMQFRNTAEARRAALNELGNPELHPEYWDEDQTPRQTLNLSSTCFARAVPAAGGVFLYFQSNPTKGYFYPSAGTTAETAKRVADLFAHGSVGKYYHAAWGKVNGARKKVSKSGKSYSYRLRGGGSLDLKKFDKMGSRYGTP